jgi:hypothetical protein
LFSGFRKIFSGNSPSFRTISARIDKFYGRIPGGKIWELLMQKNLTNYLGDNEDPNQIQELTEEELKYGSEYRLDSKNYTLESREERTARLEERWIRERMAGLSSLDQHAESDEGEIESYEKLQKLIGNFFFCQK